MSGTAIAANCGEIVSVRGSVVDVRLDDHLPPTYLAKLLPLAPEEPQRRPETRRCGSTP